MKIDEIPEQRIAEYITTWNSARYFAESDNANCSVFSTTSHIRKMILKTRRVNSNRVRTCFLLGLFKSTYIPTTFSIIPSVATIGIIPPYMTKSSVMGTTTSSETLFGFKRCEELLFSLLFSLNTWNKVEFQDLTRSKSFPSFCAVLTISFSRWCGPVVLFKRLRMVSGIFTLPESTIEKRSLLSNISRIPPVFLFLVAIFNSEKSLFCPQNLACCQYPIIQCKKLYQTLYKDLYSWKVEQPH